MPFLPTPTEVSIQALQTGLLQEGALRVVGYCKRCKDAVELDANRLCARCRSGVKGARFVKPQESEGEMTKLRKEAAGRNRRRRIWIAVGGGALLLCVLCVGLSMWSSQIEERNTTSTAALASPTQVLSALPTPTLSSLRKPTTSATSTLSPADKPTPHATAALLPTRTSTAPPTSTSLPDAVVNIEALNLRAGPDTHYDNVGLLHRGDTPQVLARTTAGDWLAVRTASGDEGWVFAAYVDLNLSLESVPVVSEIPPTSTPSGPTSTPLPPVDAEIERIAQGKHGELAQPSEVGGVAAGGEAEVTIVNDTPYELTILVGDPSSVSITIEACATCKVYSFVGPVFCPEEGRSQAVVRLKPGPCKVAARVSDPSVIPFLGSWELKADTRYFNCFYIVTRFQ